MTRERRRELLLKAGADLVRQRFRDGSLDPLGSVTAAHVEEQAGRTVLAETGESLHLSKGPIYYLWSDGLDGYKTDLALELCERSVDTEGLGDEAAIVFSEEKDWRQIVRRLANWEFVRLAPGGRHNEDQRLYALLSAVSTPRLAERLNTEADSTLDEYAILYKALIEAAGRRIKVGKGQTEEGQLRLLASVLSATVVGFAQEAAFDKRLMQRLSLPDHGDDWSPFAIVAVSMMDLLTEDATSVTADEKVESIRPPAKRARHQAPKL
jgi:hypothetical protein